MSCACWRTEEPLWPGEGESHPAVRRKARLFYTERSKTESSFMPSTAAPVNAQRLPTRTLRRFAWAVLVYFIAVILWGTLVRATGSGAGCGDHWPLCNGTVMQHSPRVDTIIEFTHRITSGLSFFLAVGLLVWTFAGTMRGHLARAAAVATVVVHAHRSDPRRIPRQAWTNRAEPVAAPRPLSRAAPHQHFAAPRRAHAHRAYAQPQSMATCAAASAG